jgi:hypothetical protein
VWYRVKPNQHTGEPVLGEPALEIHAYNTKDQNEESQQSSDDEQRIDPLDDEIRRSPATISPIQIAAPIMLTTTRMTPLVTVTMG